MDALSRRMRALTHDKKHNVPDSLSSLHGQQFAVLQT